MKLFRTTKSTTSVIARVKYRALDAILFSVFSLLFIAGLVYAAASYPDAPWGEIVGGKFMTYFNNIRWSCAAGTVISGFNADLSKNCVAAPTASAPAPSMHCTQNIGNETAWCSGIRGVNINAWCTGIDGETWTMPYYASVLNDGWVDGFNTNSCPGSYEYYKADYYCQCSYY